MIIAELAYDSRGTIEGRHERLIMELARLIRRPGESLFDTIERLLVRAALSELQLQNAAAEFLNVSPRVMSYKAIKHNVASILSRRVR